MYVYSLFIREAKVDGRWEKLALSASLFEEVASLNRLGTKRCKDASQPNFEMKIDGERRKYVTTEGS